MNNKTPLATADETRINTIVNQSTNHHEFDQLVDQTGLLSEDFLVIRDATTQQILINQWDRRI